MLHFGSAIKVTPDPMNVWSWHHTQTGNGKVPVLVDFDKNGPMDTENHCFRFMITDMQLSLPDGTVRLPPPAWVRLQDDNGSLWNLPALTISKLASS